jgi:short-chain fatty acids transporter
MERIYDFLRGSLPSAFNTCLYLTVIVMGLGLWRIQSGSWSHDIGLVVKYWYDGFTDKRYLPFAFQMALMLLAGGALANASAVRLPLNLLARWSASSNTRAVMSVFVVSYVSGLINWGFSLVVSGLLARSIRDEVSSRRTGGALNYPLVVAAAYMGLLIWHCGLSASAPLLAADPASGLAFGGRAPVPAGVFPHLQGANAEVSLRHTLMSPANLLAIGVVLLTALSYFWLVARRKIHSMPYLPVGPAGAVDEYEVVSASSGFRVFADGLSRVMSTLVMLFLAIASAWLVVNEWESKRMNAVTVELVAFVFLFLGLVLHIGKGPRAYYRTIEDSARHVGPIVLQFPFYFGILGVMTQAKLVPLIGEWLGPLARHSETGYYISTYLIACVVNIFIPSGGGQWHVQGPVAVEAARQLMEANANVHIDPGMIVMAVAWGDQTTNLMQPFWLLTITQICGVDERRVLAITVLLVPFAVLAFAGVILAFSCGWAR